jgi:hypothetical protein
VTEKIERLLLGYAFPSSPLKTHTIQNCQFGERLIAVHQRPDGQYELIYTRLTHPTEDPGVFDVELCAFFPGDVLSDKYTWRLLNTTCLNGTGCVFLSRILEVNDHD